ETFLRAFNHLSRYDISRPMWPWLRTIATNLALDHVRARKRAQERSTDDAPAASPEDSYLQVEQRRAIVQALSALPRRQQTALALRYLHDWSSTDTASFLGLSNPALEQLLFRGRQRLRVEFKRLSERTGLAGVIGPGGWIATRWRALRDRVAGDAPLASALAAAASSAGNYVVGAAALVTVIFTGLP